MKRKFQIKNKQTEGGGEGEDGEQREVYPYDFV